MKRLFFSIFVIFNLFVCYGEIQFIDVFPVYIIFNNVEQYTSAELTIKNQLPYITIRDRSYDNDISASYMTLGIHHFRFEKFYNSFKPYLEEIKSYISGNRDDLEIYFDQEYKEYILELSELSGTFFLYSFPGVLTEAFEVSFMPYLKIQEETKNVYILFLPKDSSEREVTFFLLNVENFIFDHAGLIMENLNNRPDGN
ncbi:MAG: hypothetical protein JEZ08_25140 [Clostridiales bacterium]|nr:hypothetical protein [Clostridiales bacterium]